MKLTDIKKVDREKLLNEKVIQIYDTLSQDTDGFNPDFIELREDEILEFLKIVKEKIPAAYSETIKKTPKPRKVPEKPFDFNDPDIIENVMQDYQLTRIDAKKLITLRKEADELKKQNLEVLLKRLAKSKFYKGQNSPNSIDKGRTRDLGKDSKQSAITKAEEIKMTGKPFKRISKAGRKNQFGTTKGGNVYYEYRMNRRDVDNKIKLETGGGVGIPNAEKMQHLPFEISIYVPSTKDVDKNITAVELRARVKEVQKYLSTTFGGFSSAEKVGGYLSNKNSIITEKVIPVTSFASMQSFRENKRGLVNKISIWAKKWGQEAIGFEFEGDLYYVPQKFVSGGKLKATYIPNRDIKTLTTIWGNNIKGKDLLDGAYTTRKNIKTAPKMSRIMFEDEMYEYAKGGAIYVDLFEDYENIPLKVQVILNKYAEKFGDDFDEMDYKDTQNMLEDFEEVGYTFGYGLDNVPYGLRPVGVRLNQLKNFEDYDDEEFAKGGKAGVKSAKKPIRKKPQPKMVRQYFEDSPYDYREGGNVK